jgi:hypothetical protein
VGGITFLCKYFIPASESKYYCVGYNELIEIQKQFTNDTGLDINIDALIKKDWIRLVYGIIKIPNLIHSASKKVATVVECQNEITFLCEIQKEEGITKEIFTKLINGYEKEHNLRLDIEKASKHHLFEEKDRKIKIHNASIYKVILNHLDEFKFVDYLYNQIYPSRKDSQLIIEKDLFNEIIQKHKTLFPQTPAIEELAEKDLFKETSSHYEIKINTWKADINRIGAILWENIINDPKFESDFDRMKFWYSRIAHEECRWCDIGKFFNQESKKQFLKVAYQIVINDPDLSCGEKEYRKLKLDQLHGNILNLEHALSEDCIEFPTSEDLFIWYDNLLLLDKDWQSNLLFEQESRHPLSYFINQIVKNEPLCTDGKNYKMIFELLNDETLKPFILWQVCFVIYYKFVL